MIAFRFCTETYSSTLDQSGKIFETKALQWPTKTKFLSAILSPTPLHTDPLFLDCILEAEKKKKNVWVQPPPGLCNQPVQTLFSRIIIHILHLHREPNPFLDLDSWWSLVLTRDLQSDLFLRSCQVNHHRFVPLVKFLRLIDQSMWNLWRPPDWPSQICFIPCGNIITIPKKQCAKFQACVCSRCWDSEAWKRGHGPNFTVKISAGEKVETLPVSLLWNCSCEMHEIFMDCCGLQDGFTFENRGSPESHLSVYGLLEIGTHKKINYNKNNFELWSNLGPLYLQTKAH